MKQWTMPALLVALFYHVSSHGQTQNPDEFLNFTYSLPMCAKEFGTPKTVTLNNGEFQNEEFLVYLDREGIFHGDKAHFETNAILNTIENLDQKEYEDKRVVIKGCGDKYVSPAAYTAITQKLRPVVKSLMFGEPCSTVPIYKK